MISDLVDVCTFCACVLRRKLTRTHIHQTRRTALASSMYLLENVPSKSVCPISRSDRKNLAVHVSLSSIFTMSKSGPRVPLSRATSVEARLPNFWEQDFASGYPAAYLPYQKIAVAGPQGRLHQRGGLYGRPFGVSTPENDKTEKKQNRRSWAPKTPAPLGFPHPRR